MIVAGAAARGVAPPELLAAAGVDPARLADPDGRLPRAAEARMWHEAARLTGDEHFGLHLSELAPIDEFGALGYAIRGSATLGDAYQRTIRYLRVMAHGPTLELVLDRDLARLRHEAPRGEAAPARHAVELLMASLVRMARRGVDPDFMPRSVRFRHAAPPRPEEHARVLGPGVRFGQAHDEVELPRELLGRPMVDAEPALSAVLDQHLTSQLAALPADGGFLERVRGAVAAEISGGDPALDAVAGRLGMSTRSLQRRLAQEGSSLSSELDRVRTDMAVRYLSDSAESIAEVAFLLGFSEVSTFHRAFKRWTGVTPAAYRRGGRPALPREGRGQGANSAS